MVVTAVNECNVKLFFLIKHSLPDLTGWQDDAGNTPEEPAASEAGDGSEGRRGEAHHHVRHRHVTHQQVHTRVQGRGPETKKKYWFGTKRITLVEHYIKTKGIMYTEWERQLKS